MCWREEVVDGSQDAPQLADSRQMCTVELRVSSSKLCFGVKTQMVMSVRPPSYVPIQQL